MYGRTLGAGVAVVSSGAVLMLPNTGGSLFVNIAISLGIGLAVWGVSYTRAR